MAEIYRKLFEEWFSHYAQKKPKERENLRNSFREGNRSGFFELFLHELFLSLNCHVEVHPDLPNTTKHTDFLVTDPSGHSVYIEARVASERPSASRGKRREALSRIIRPVRAPEFVIFLFGEGSGAGLPIAGQVRKFLYEQLRQLDAKTLREQFRAAGFDSMPMLVFDDGVRRLQFRVVPRTSSPASSFGGAWGATMHLVDPIRPMRQAILEKGSGRQYGDLPHPLIVALDVDYWMLSDQMIDDALYGDVNPRIFSRGDRTFTQWLRTSPGAFTDASRSAPSRVSAALVFTDPNPFRFHEAAVTLWPNRGAVPYSGVLQGFPQRFRQEERVPAPPGLTTAHVLRLPEGWPLSRLRPGTKLL